MGISLLAWQTSTLAWGRVGHALWLMLQSQIFGVSLARNVSKLTLRDVLG